MTDAEIIKGLRAVAKKYEGKPVATFETNISAMATDAANHIERLCDENNRQKAEIERLSDRNHKCVYLSDDETTEFCVDGPCPEHKTVGEIKAEAIKCFAERLKEYIGDDLYFEIETNAFLILIDKLIYEMVGDDNENL